MRYKKKTAALWGGGGEGGGRGGGYFPCSADHERDWPPCKVVFFWLATNMQTVCVCVCVVIPFIQDFRLVDAPTGVTQEEGHTEFLHLPSAVLALIFIARRIQPSLSLVDREVEFYVPTN